MIRSSLGLTIFLLILSASVGAAGDPVSCVVTIKSVQLKNDKGRWLTVIEPDHEVDVVAREPGLSFFNNGRVPEGAYVNFKLVLSGDMKTTGADGRDYPLKKTDRPPGLEDAIEIYGSHDFAEPIFVKRGSFIGAWFSVDLKGSLEGSYFSMPKKISALTVTVDNTTLKLGPGDVTLLT